MLDERLVHSVPVSPAGRASTEEVRAELPRGIDLGEAASADAIERVERDA